MENVALQSQLQAISLGASMAQRRIENQRLQQQLQMQVGEQVMRQRQYELQNKIQETALAQSLREQDAMNTEFDQFNQFNQQVSDFLNNPDPQGKIPTPPPFKSKTYQQEANRAIQGMDQYSNRAQMMKARDAYNRQRMGAVTDLLSMGIDVTDPQTGQVIEEKYQASLPILQRQRELGNLPQDVRAEVIKIGPSVPMDQAIKTAQETIEAKKFAQPTAAVRNAKAIVESRKKMAETNGVELNQAEIDRLNKEAIEAGGKLRPLDANMSKKLENDFASLETVDYLLGRISDFEGKNKVSFSEYLGVIPTSIQKLQSRITEEKDPQKREALAILSDFYGALNEVGRTTSGLTVTEGERTRIEQRIGSAFDKNSLIKLRSYRDEKERGLRGVIRRNIDRDLPTFAEQYLSSAPGTTVYSLYEQTEAPAQPQVTQPGATNSAPRRLRFDAQGNPIQ